MEITAMLDRRAVLFAAALCVAAAGAGAEGDSRGKSRDHDEARRAFQRGEIRSLSDILTELKAQLSGEVIEVELKRRGQSYIYEVKVVTPNGRVREVDVDAATGKVMKTESR
jgi:uncharacterized membrane protein YkoI